MLEDGDDFPEARTMGQIDKDLGRPAGRFIYSAITADVEDDSERVNVYLPKSLLSQIQRFGERTGIDNRSTFMRLAARYYLSRESEGQTLKVKAAGGLSGVRAVPKGKKPEQPGA